MAATIDDIARVAGVGRSTVCRALRNEARIRPDTKARILAIADDLKYRPNRIARSLALGKSRMVGILATPTVIPVFNTLIEPIETALRKSGYSMLFNSASGDPVTERATIEHMIDNQVAGVIVHPRLSKPDAEIYKKLINFGANVVVIDRYVEGLEVPQIVLNGYQTARLATAHLMSFGHRKIANLTISHANYAGQERLRGYRDALSAAGISENPSYIIETQLSPEDGTRAMEQLLNLADRPTAIICRHDFVAIGAMRAILAAGLSIPRDISVIGAGDCWYDDMLRVPLTSLHYPYEDLSSIAVGVLLDMMEGRQFQPSVQTLDATLVKRSSIAPPA